MLIQHVVDVLVILKAKIKSVLLQSFTSDKCGSVVLSLYGVCNHIITYAIKFDPSTKHILHICHHAQSFLLISL